MRKKITPLYLIKNISSVVGLVLIWRGVWYILDEIDLYIFWGNPFWTAVAGIILGLIILYIPDKNLKGIEQL